MVRSKILSNHKDRISKLEAGVAKEELNAILRRIDSALNLVKMNKGISDNKHLWMRN